MIRPGFHPLLRKLLHRALRPKAKTQRCRLATGPSAIPPQDSPPPSRNLAEEFDTADQFARDDPHFRQDVMDSLPEAAVMLPVVVPHGGATGDHQPGYHSLPCSFNEESMGVSSPPRPKPKRTRQDRSPQLEHMCRPRTRSRSRGARPRIFDAQAPATPLDFPPRAVHRTAPGRRSRRTMPPAQRAHLTRTRRGGPSPPTAGVGRTIGTVGRTPLTEMDSERRRNWREESARTSATRHPKLPMDGDVATGGNGDAAATNDAAGPAASPLLSMDDWHLLVRLPDRPSEEDLRHLPGTVLVALLRANGISYADGCTRADAWTAIARWLAQHLELPLALPLGRLRLAPSPQRGRRSARRCRSQSYDSMIEMASEGAAAATLSPSDVPSEQAHAPTTGAPSGTPEAPRRPRTSRQDELLRQLPPAPTAEHLQRLNVDALRELLRANGVETAPRARKKKLRSAVLRLVADPGSTIRLPDGLCRTSNGVPVAPALSPNADGTSDDAPCRTMDDAQRRSLHVRRPAGPDQGTGEPRGAPHRPSRGHGATGDASGRAAELPAMPHQAPAYTADPDVGKLSAAVLAALERLPTRPSAAQLRETKFAGLQVLLKTNGVPRPSNATVESMTRQLGAWLAEHAGRVLELPHGVQRSGWRPLGDPPAVHRAGRSVGHGRRTRDMSPPRRDGNTRTATAGPDADLLPHLGAPAHPANASRRSQASGRASSSILRRPYNGSGETGEPGRPPKTSGAGNQDGDQLADDERIARAAVAFTDSAASTLALLDRLAPLINRACRGESIPAEALAPLGPAVHTARAVLQGVVAGCTAERLRPTLTRASGGTIAPAAGGPSHAGAPRTYAQVASTAPRPPVAPRLRRWCRSVRHSCRRKRRSTVTPQRAPARSAVHSTQCCVGSWAWAPDRRWRRSDGPAKVTTRCSLVRRRGSGWTEKGHGRCRDSERGTGPPTALSGSAVRWC